MTSQATKAHSVLAARSRRSFIDEVVVRHGPRAELGRYFLYVEKQLRDKGLTVVFAPFGAIAALNREHYASWGFLLPMLDPELHAVEDEHSIAFLVVDQSGEAISSMAARLYDFDVPFKDTVENLSFYYGERAPEMAGRVRSTMTAMKATTLRGRAAYLGGYWLRPDVRGLGLSTTIPRLMRYIALATWDAPIEFSYGRLNFLRPEVANTYAFCHVERGFHFYMNERLILEGVMLWTSRVEMLKHLAGLLPGTSVNDGGSEQIVLSGVGG